MKLAKAIITAIIFLVGILCVSLLSFGQDVHYNYDRGTNFANYKTYEWIDSPRDAVPDQLIEQSIRRIVDEELAHKGFSRVESAGQIKVSYHALITLEKAVSFSRTGDAMVGGGVAWGSEIGQAQTSTIPVGILVIDLVDSSRNQLIWRGDAVKAIDLKKDTNKNYRSLQKAIQKLLKNYPPKQDK